MNKRIAKRQPLYGLCLLALYGASVGTAAADDDRDVRELDAITVTAQKRAQRTIDVPLGLSVLGKDEVAARGVDSTQDLSFAVPGLILRYDAPGSTQVFMRGIGNLTGSDALVATYLDEVPVTLTGGFRQLDLRVLDIDSIEVLKGPQGTLYGQGAMAGTIRYITTAPRLDAVEGSLKFDYSEIAHGDGNPKLTGVFNVPLIKDRLALRVAATKENGGGWIDQPEAGIKDGNYQNLYNVRAKLLFQATDAVQLSATVARYSNRSKLNGSYENADRTYAAPGGEALPSRHDWSTLYNLTATVDFDAAQLTSSTSYVTLDRDYALSFEAGAQTLYADYDYQGYDVINDRAKQFTQELRLSSRPGAPLQYTVGTFYRNASADLYDEGMSYYYGVGYPYTYLKDDTSESLSLFADASYALSERLDLGAGLRWFHDRASAYYGDAVLRETFKSTDPRVYFTYALTPQWNLYGNVAKGFRSGGFNTSGLPAYKPEKLINYEIGTKGVSAGGAVQFDLALFYSQYKDALRRGYFFSDAYSGALVSYTTNIGRLDVRGVELGLTWNVGAGLALSANGAYYHSEVREVGVDAAAGEYASVEVGDRGDYVPRLSYTLAADWRFDWSSRVAGTFRIDFNHRDRIYYTDDLQFLPAYRVQSSQSVDLVNLRLGAEWSRYRTELYVTNLTDQNRLVDPFAAWSQAARTKPRTVGVSFSVNF
ncbi:MAG: TonB-dependent receptor [Pseudoxanthomonas sp.]